MNKLKAIGVISHRTNPECYPSFEVTTCRTEYNFGSYYLFGVRADTGGTYSVMAASWKFDKYANLSNKDGDGMNKEGEIIDELIEDERHDCETQPEKTEWAVGDKPPVNVWLDCMGVTSGTVLDVVKFLYLGNNWAIAHSKLVSDMETAIAWKQYSYRIHIDPKEKALAEIALALAINVMGEDAAKEIDFNHDNDFSCDYRNMAQAIIDGCIGHVEYTGGK
ncbi:TPA: hypothetical protein RI296_002391 [Escherichia coli]|uniref:hypothetical protein n=1 Tax=Escherichia coli TaxID=562 RepID=UPI00102F1E38|nr:hypothetical protein [Escherichia coli]QBF91666.1 hypothetical protein EYD11_12415 [Escherichia coli]HDV4831549.1 hypothetical protein [Escherichia coli]HDV4864970.1 hypothetical protein [Escherichia coli]HDV4874561.1 hypothetical protein [Escherichia coli]